MKRTRASYFDGSTSDTSETELLFTNDGRIVLLHDGRSTSYVLSDVKFSSRLGNTPRVLTLPDGGTCHIADNDMVDAFLNQQKTARAASVLHLLESRVVYVLAALLLTAIFSWGMVTYGIPALAAKVAYNLPESVDLALGKGTLNTLDKIAFEPSQLDPKTQARLQKRFAEMKRHIPNSASYRLVFRSSEKIGANAFALPSGIIVVTDGLVKISKNDDEIVAVLAHEIGHLVHRHAIRMAMQNSAVALLIAGITGDPISTSSLIAAMPTVLINSKYSREFETEADDYAYQYMVNNHMDTRAFANILERITGSDKQTGFESYLSSHPGTDQRVRRFR
jgi:Zn-dependent protease with chaperone function